MIRVVCPTCKAQFDAPDQYAGRAATCPNCNGRLTVPMASANAPSVPPVPAFGGGVPGVPMQHGGLAVAGMVCGIVGLVLAVVGGFCLGCFILPIALPTALAGLICSIIALVTAKKANRKKGMAIAGLILSILAIIWVPLVFFMFLGGLAALGAGAAASMPRL